MRPNRPYTRIVNVWDSMGQDQHSLKMVKYVRDIFKKFDIRPRSGLDLCCGTGSAIKVFVDQGYAMAGLDGSSQMIAAAGAKLKGTGVRLYHKQLPKFRLLDNHKSSRTVTFDFVTCFYDSLNYMLNERDLKATFKSVRAHLNKNGWFIFDMNTPEALKNIWGGQTWADARDDIAWIWKNEFNPRTTTALCRTTTFVKNGKQWERFEEDHYERAYPNTRIKKLLRESGFVLKGFYRCHTFDKPTKDTFRICAVARRK